MLDGVGGRLNWISNSQASEILHSNLLQILGVLGQQWGLCIKPRLNTSSCDLLYKPRSVNFPSWISRNHKQTAECLVPYFVSKPQFTSPLLLQYSSQDVRGWEFWALKSTHPTVHISHDLKKQNKTTTTNKQWPTCHQGWIQRAALLGFSVSMI